MAARQGSECGWTLSVHIDLETHSRWIRDKDPANIYRYPRWLYRLFHFPGQPNRLRPADYRQAFINAGWKNVRTSPVHRTNLVGRVHDTFDPSDMDQMTVLLEAARQAPGELSVRCLAMAGAIDLPAPTRGRRLRG